MSKQNEETFATVTFARYDEAPIACQGDDEQTKIQVITQCMAVGDDIHEDALRRSIALGVVHDSYIQVWDVQINDV